MTATLVTALVGLLLAYPWWLLCRRRPAVAVTVLIGFAVLSAHSFALLYRLGIPAEVVRGLIPVKDVLALLLAAILLPRLFRQPFRPLPRMWPGAAALLIVATVTVGAALTLVAGELETAARVARGMLIPASALVVGLALSPAERRSAFRWSAVLIAVGAVLALAEWLLPITVLTEVVRVGDYWRDVKGVPQFLINHKIGALPGNTFVSGWDPTSMRRLAGPFGDSLSAGYTLAVGALMATAVYRGWRLFVLLALTGGALLLTFTRAGWIIVALAAIPLVLSSPLPRRLRTGFVIAGGAVAAALLAVGPVHDYVASVLSGGHGSTTAHLEYLDKLGSLRPGLWGLGFGEAGAVTGHSTENAVATTLLQLGIVLGIAYWTGTVLLVIASARRWQNLVVWGSVLLGIIISMMVSEQWLTFNSGWPLALLLGAGVCFADGRADADPGVGTDLTTQVRPPATSPATAER